MIIECTNCNKKFEIDSALIPAKGRLLQCSHCDNRWFFKKEENGQVLPETINKVKLPESIAPIKKEIINETPEEPINENLKSKLDNNISIDPIIKKNVNKKKINNNTVGYNFLNIILVVVISLVALIILVDTLKKPISIIIPNIEIILYNLYETIKDIILFFKDLIY
jgi:predicted Zn finger-like uncharacterized protein